MAHRGLSHSFFFVVIATILLAFLCQRWYKSGTTTLNFWLLFFGIELLSHIFIDAFNAYGTGWFEPFSHYRVSFNTVFVADPFFSASLIIATIVLVLMNKANATRRSWALFGLGISTLYVSYCLANKIKTDADAKDILQMKHIVYDRHFTTPTPLNSWLWYVVAGNDSGFYIGYRSVFDSKKEMDLYYVPRNDFLLSPYYDREDVQHLIRFSKGFYAIEKWNDTLVFNDLRFGQIVGWHDPKEKFVLHYFLQDKKANKLVVQRSRFAKWDAASIRSLVKRIEGN